MFNASPILVAALGAEGALNQIDRIRQGLAAQPGVNLIEDISSADLVYVNNPGPAYDAVLAAKANHELKRDAKVLLNVLDIPVQLVGKPGSDYGFEKIAVLGQQLTQADAVTSISRYTQAQLQHFYGIGSYVVYNPVKPVSPAKRLAGERPYPFRAMCVGRVNDLNKRQSTIGIPAMIMAGLEEREVAICGTENPGWGTYLGPISDEMLNDLYNSVDFLMQPTQLTGWELPITESIICGAVPLVCHDLTTITEMPISRHAWVYPSVHAMAYRIRTLIDNPHILETEKQHSLGLSEGLVEEMGQNAVARRILGVYNRINGTV